MSLRCVIPLQTEFVEYTLSERHPGAARKRMKKGPEGPHAVLAALAAHNMRQKLSHSPSDAVA